MAIYPRATVVRRSGKKGWYACVTVPPELRELFPSPQRYKKIKGAETKQDGWDNYKQYEAKIYLDFDRANVANHPLCKAYAELWDALRWIGEQRNVDPKTNTLRDIKHPAAHELFATENTAEQLFDNEVRWELYDEIKNRAGYVLAAPSTGISDPEEAMAIDSLQEKIRPLAQEFDIEFRKVSQESFAPKKRGALFREVAEEYHKSNLFLRNKKTQELKRQKTLNKEIEAVQLFLQWASAAITVDEFGYKLATDYMEALADKSSGLIDFRGRAPSNETIAAKLSAIKNVLNWAVRNEYIVSNPWQEVNVAGYGEAKQSYRDWTEDELRQVFSLDMPEEDYLCLAILACTGARLDEIALLEWDQFDSGITKGGQTVHWLDTTDAIVKNKPSRRLIPILPKLAELIKAHPRGLNKKEPDRLFSYLRQGGDGKAENKASRALMVHLRKISRDDNFAVHGLRHTVTTMCRVERMDWEMREFMLGRGGVGEGANYGKAAHVDTVLDAMSNFDISFLDGQKATTKQ